MKEQLEEIFEVEIVELIPKLKSYIRMFIFDDDLANDILQETLISALSKLLELQEPFNISGWMMRVAKNKCLNFIKQQKRTVRLENIPEKYLYALNETAEQHFADEQLIASLNNLPHSQKYLMQMKYFTHHSISEISKLFKIPEGTVKRRLFDARQKLKKEMEMKKAEGNNEERIAPEIKIIPKKESKKKSVKVLGYGLNFGAPLAGVGDVEVYESYEYPGRILINKFESKVTRKTKIFDREVLEVLDRSVSEKTKTTKYFYYTFNEQKVSIIFRVLDFPKELMIHIDQEDLMSPQELNIKVGEFNEPEKDNQVRIVDVVDIKIGDKFYKDVIRQRSCSDDYHGRNYGEEYYNSEGREILQRNYIGENWKMGGFVTWEKWKDAPEVKFNGEKFRLWFEFILVDHYKES
jgi:RNA polymerase sigma-70 factor, ECF subfamily